MDFWILERGEFLFRTSIVALNAFDQLKALKKTAGERQSLLFIVLCARPIVLGRTDDRGRILNSLHRMSRLFQF